jgi:hypothetical protein
MNNKISLKKMYSMQRVRYKYWTLMRDIRKAPEQRAKYLKLFNRWGDKIRKYLGGL